MEFDYSRLRGKITEIYRNIDNFSYDMKRSRGYVSKVLNNKAFLRQEDIIEWANALHIKLEDIPDYFFKPM